MMLPPSTPSSRTKKTTTKKNAYCDCLKTRAHKTATRSLKDTYPKHEGIDDEQGFKAGDDRFGFHCAADVRAAANGEQRGSVCAGGAGGCGSSRSASAERLRFTLRDEPRRRSGSLPTLPDLGIRRLLIFTPLVY